MNISISNCNKEDIYIDDEKSIVNTKKMDMEKLSKNQVWLTGGGV